MIGRKNNKLMKGLTRSQLIEISKLPEGGGTSKTIEELQHAGFISQYYPFGKKKKNSLFRLTDEYSLFYIQFIEKNQHQNIGIWQQLSQTSNYNSWAGYTFESVCLKHIPQIKKALGISSVYTTVSTFINKGSENEDGLQIDLLIDRNDHVINICEMKFYSGELTISKSMAIDFRSKVTNFKATTNIKKQVFLTLITTFGLKENKHSLGLIDTTLTMDCLFE